MRFTEKATPFWPLGQQSVNVGCIPLQAEAEGCRAFLVRGLRITGITDRHLAAVKGEAEAKLGPDGIGCRPCQWRSARKPPFGIIWQSINANEPGAATAQPMRLIDVARCRCRVGSGVLSPGQHGFIRGKAQKPPIVEFGPQAHLPLL
jgi:hypothetical protein